MSFVMAVAILYFIYLHFLKKKDNYEIDAEARQLFSSYLLDHGIDSRLFKGPIHKWKGNAHQLYYWYSITGHKDTLGIEIDVSSDRLIDGKVSIIGEGEDWLSMYGTLYKAKIRQKEIK